MEVDQMQSDVKGSLISNAEDICGAVNTRAKGNMLG